MNNKTKIIILSIAAITVVILEIILGSNLFKSKKIEKFKLESKYYNTGEKIDVTNIDDIKDESFLLFTYNSFCGMAKPCEDIFHNVLSKNKIDYVSMLIDDFRKTDFHETVKYAPSFLIIEKGKIIAYLDAENDDDLKYYQNEDDFENWLKKYILFE